ncbi:MAG: amylo-alpha-1,6-glucosidase [Chthoniobacter sp.]|uniref:amylo-alpha-1,6-glucosidase n=1 Tax=Chthoniobacter sp. TaxID=2510640 RepID=UPI0032A1BAA4
MPASLPPLDAEWLEADGLGGFASGTVSGIRTRRYHALLLTATTPPAGRMALVNGFDAWVETPQGTFAISSQRYAPDVVHPDGVARLESFTCEPWPRWTWRLTEDLQIEQEIFTVHGKSAVFVAWKLIGEPRGPVTLKARPFLSIRDFHGMQHENGAFGFAPTESFEHVVWQPYEGAPGVVGRSNGLYRHEPTWYRNFLYVDEAARGLDATEDVASPGTFHWDLAVKPAVWLFTPDNQRLNHLESTEELYVMTRRTEMARRGAFESPLHRAADAYLVKRGSGRTLIAGYPWFGDWGRDTFIALRGLCIATGRLEDARDILLEWAGAVSEGMLPNRFPDRGENPEFNSVDASLWYVIAVHEYIEAAEHQCPASFIADCHTQRMRQAVEEILTGYSSGTRFGIRADTDGLLACGQPGVQLTWMDAKVGDWVVTPRIGKPVEIQALWINALWIGLRSSPQWEPLLEKARASFHERFWNEATGGLFDVVDCDHRRGVNDGTIRPNQIFAVGGLPLPLIEGDRARRIVATVEEKLITPLGLRSLAPGEPGYAPHYEGGVWQRDSTYHQGTVWPWLIGPFVEAWLRTAGDVAAAKAAARTRFLAPLQRHLGTAGLGHISEIADAESSYTPRGCPFQAWSLGELLRLEKAIS